MLFYLVVGVFLKTPKPSFYVVISIIKQFLINVAPCVLTQSHNLMFNALLEYTKVTRRNSGVVKSFTPKPRNVPLAQPGIRLYGLFYSPASHIPPVQLFPQEPDLS